jgi:hypothetical protein
MTLPKLSAKAELGSALRGIAAEMATEVEEG